MISDENGDKKRPQANGAKTITEDLESPAPPPLLTTLLFSLFAIEAFPKPETFYTFFILLTLIFHFSCISTRKTRRDRELVEMSLNFPDSTTDSKSNEAATREIFVGGDKSDKIWEKFSHH